MCGKRRAGPRTAVPIKLFVLTAHRHNRYLATGLGRSIGILRMVLSSPVQGSYHCERRGRGSQEHANTRSVLTSHLYRSSKST
jgi:hypothetical protein